MLAAGATGSSSIETSPLPELRSEKSRLFYQNRTVQVCDNTNHKHDLFEISARLSFENCLGLSDRIICQRDDCQFRLTSERKESLLQDITEQEKSLSTADLEYEKLLLTGYELLETTNASCHEDYGKHTIEDAAVEVLAKSYYGLSRTHRSAQTAKYLYAAALLNKAEHYFTTSDSFSRSLLIDIADVTDALIKAQAMFSQLSPHNIRLDMTENEIAIKNKQSAYILAKCYLLKSIALLSGQIIARKDKTISDRLKGKFDFTSRRDDSKEPLDSAFMMYMQLGSNEFTQLANLFMAVQYNKKDLMKTRDIVPYCDANRFIKSNTFKVQMVEYFRNVEYSEFNLRQYEALSRKKNTTGLNKKEKADLREQHKILIRQYHETYYQCILYFLIESKKSKNAQMTHYRLCLQELHDDHNIHQKDRLLEELKYLLEEIYQ